MSASRKAQPITREFLADDLTPLGVYRRLETLSPVRFLFESVAGGEQVSRYSFLGAGPRQLFRLWPDRLEAEDEEGKRVVPGAPLDALRQVTGEVSAVASEVPFAGGFVGYFGYDLVRLLERLPAPPPDPFGLPTAILARYDTVVVFDHARQRVLAVANEIEGEVSRRQAEDQLSRLAELLTASAGGGGIEIKDSSKPARPVDVETEASLSGERYQAGVRTIKQHIARGDIYQAVLARRFRLGEAVEPSALYRALRAVNPSPYMVLFEAPEVALVGTSPEMLVRKTGDRIETRPIAGTRRRDADPEEDRRLAEELLADAKERAEHVMLVDLGRNDLGKVSRAGSVRVSTFMGVERYSHVMHIVSEVEGRLQSGCDALDALLACFPAGTVTGAPKIRAMEIIDDLEPEARGPYAGAVGYLSYGGDLDTCITIRTLVVRENEISVTAGAGIVADSDPRAEQLETESKAAALLAAVDLARNLERAEEDSR